MERGLCAERGHLPSFRRLSLTLHLRLRTLCSSVMPCVNVVMAAKPHGRVVSSPCLASLRMDASCLSLQFQCLAMGDTQCGFAERKTVAPRRDKES